MVTDIKRKIAERQLQRWVRANRHPRRIVDFHGIKTIGILYDATAEGAITELKQAVKKLAAMGKEIYTLGYINRKKLPPNLLPNTREDFFTRSDLHWNGLPIKDRISRFANEPFDYLLNVYKTGHFPLMGISAMSKAGCRIGSFNKRYTGCYDFMISGVGDLPAPELLDAFVLNLYKFKNG